MASLFRRAGATIARFFQSAADPAAEPNVVKVYAKDVAGVVQAFARTEDGTISQLTPVASGGDPAVIFDDAVPAAEVNIRSDRASNQSPIDNTKAGITNLGSVTGTIPGATGATGAYSAIGGGDDNTASGDYSTVPGGQGNEASGIGAYAQGFRTLALGDYSHAEGEFGEADAEASHSEGSSWVIAGFAAHAEGAATVESDYGHAEGESEVGALADGAHAEGRGLVADGSIAAHAEGQGTVSTNSPYSHAEGFNTAVASGVTAGHAEGRGSTANANYAHAEGDFCDADGVGAHAEGGSTEATGTNAHSEGNGTHATGLWSHAEGIGNRAVGEAAHAQNALNEATGEMTHAMGAQAQALRATQFSYASGDSGGFGSFPTAARQVSWLMFRGATAGAGINENTLLGFGSTVLFTNMALEDLRSYNFRVTAVINGRQVGPVYVTKTIKLEFNMRRVGGVATLVASVADVTYGDAGAASWTLVAAAAAGGLTLTFDTGGGTASACNVACHVEWQEVRFAA
jgi:hypothetical protein